MKMQKMLKRAAAVASGALVLSGTTGMDTADTSATEDISVASETAEDTAAAETAEASADAAAEDEQKMPEDWVKADISEYDSSLTLISYELATPEMAKVGEPVDPYAGLSEEERKAREEAVAKKKSALRKGTPTLSKNAAKSRSKKPTAVEVKTNLNAIGKFLNARN